MSDIVWEEPPPLRRHLDDGWVARLTPLVEHPKRWANLGEQTPNVASRLRYGKLITPPGKWEFTTRHLPGMAKDRAILYARYLGPTEDQA